MLLSPDIMPSICRTVIEPGSFEWMESDLAIIGIGSSQIDRMVCTVDIATPEDAMPECSKRIHICGELSIKHEFALPCFL
jgi:hypothetical protein